MNAVLAARRASRTIAKTFLFLVSTGAAVRAQAGRIAGSVTDSAGGIPVSGVNITVPGTTIGTVTGDNGRYTLTFVPAGTYTLEARRLGYAPVRRAGVVVTADQTTTVDFRVQSAALHLQETVITGVVDPTAGTKVPFTVGRVTREDVPVPPMNAISAIQGKVAGVAVVGPAQPGDGIARDHGDRRDHGPANPLTLEFTPSEVSRLHAMLESNSASFPGAVGTGGTDPQHQCVTGGGGVQQ